VATTVPNGSLLVACLQAQIYTFTSVFKQRVHRFFLILRPPSITVTFWMFGLNTRLVFFCEKLTLCPVRGRLPQLSHFAIIPPTLLSPASSLTEERRAKKFNRLARLFPLEFWTGRFPDHYLIG
jgi:hypothetical protein